MSFISVNGSTRVGLSMRKSQGEVLNAVRSYIINSKGDDSASSYLSVFKDRDGGKGYLTRDDLALFLRDADACAPRSSSARDLIRGPDCVSTADKVVSAMDTTGDGNVSWEEFRDKIGLDQIPYQEKSEEPVKEEPVGGTATSYTDKYSGFVRKNKEVVDPRISNLYLPESSKTTTKSSKVKPYSEETKDSFEWTPTKIGLAIGIPLGLYLILKK